MGLFSFFRKIDRRYYHVCYTCMMQTGHDALNSIFYSEGPAVLILGRPWMQCPRCGGTNTKSFQQLKDEGAEPALFGLERIAKQYPRSRFELQGTAPVTEEHIGQKN